MGWDDVGDLRQYGDSQDAIREGMRRTLPDAAPGSLTLWSGMLRRFAFEMQEGDRIIAPVRGKSLLNFGVVAGPLRVHPGRRTPPTPPSAVDPHGHPAHRDSADRTG